MTSPASKLDDLDRAIFGDTSQPLDMGVLSTPGLASDKAFVLNDGSLAIPGEQVQDKLTRGLRDWAKDQRETGHLPVPASRAPAPVPKRQLVHRVVVSEALIWLMRVKTRRSPWVGIGALLLLVGVGVAAALQFSPLATLMPEAQSDPIKDEPIAEAKPLSVADAINTQQPIILYPQSTTSPSGQGSTKLPSIDQLPAPVADKDDTTALPPSPGKEKANSAKLPATNASPQPEANMVALAEDAPPVKVATAPIPPKPPPPAGPPKAEPGLEPVQIKAAAPAGSEGTSAPRPATNDASKAARPAAQSSKEPPMVTILYGHLGISAITRTGVVITSKKTGAGQREVLIGATMPDGATLLDVDPVRHRLRTDRGVWQLQ